MGEPIPDDWPPVEGDKWYCVSGRVFSDLINPVNCETSPVMAQASDCFIGQYLIDHDADDGGCVLGIDLFTGIEGESLATLIYHIEQIGDDYGGCVSECEFHGPP